MNKTHRSQFSDADLVAHCLDGDKAAFGKLINRHRLRLERLLQAMLADPFQVDDVWQETLLRAYLNLEQLQNPSRFGAWIYSIAVNLARTRRNVVLPGLLSLEVVGNEWPDQLYSSPEESAVKQDMSDRVRQAVADLPPAEREAMVLVYLKELSHKEAAIQLGANLSTIKVRVHRGRRRLRAVLQDKDWFISQADAKERSMIKVKVHDVMVARVNPTEEVEANPTPRLQDILSPHRVIIVKEETGDRAIAIWIGPFEADDILTRLRDMSQIDEYKLKRPRTHDLTKTLLEVGEISVERVTVSRLHENTFYANLIVKAEAGVSEVDCRPSDAINLALRVDAPIFVAPEVMELCGFTPDTNGNYTWARQQAVMERINPKTDENEVKSYLWFSLLNLNNEQIKQLIKERNEFFGL